MTPLTLFLYGLALAGSVLVVGFALMFVWGVFCYFFAPEKAPAK